MRWAALFLLLPGCCLAGISSSAVAEETSLIGDAVSGVPVHTAILTRRYGAVVPEQEIAGEELENGLGATNTFQFVHWRRWNRPYGWGGWGMYGRWGWGWGGVGGPWYGVGFGPRFYGYYPWGGWGGYPSWYNMYWGTPAWGGGFGWGGYPVTTFYGPVRPFRARFGGCYYW